MENGRTEYYYMPSLLQLDSLNVRRAAKDSDLTAGAYFDLLSQFLFQAPKAEGALQKFIGRNGDIEAYKKLDDIIIVLKKMECDTFITEFYSILGAYETGNWRLASYHAESVIERFDIFCKKISAAKRTVKPVPYPDMNLTMYEFINNIDLDEDNRKLVVLAVDDSPVILKSVSSVLSDAYKVYTLLKPEMLHEILKKITPELFLLDYKMPEINGFELIPIIRSYKEHINTPIVFLTSEGTLKNVTAALSLGASDFIVKPFKPEELRAKIAKWIVRNRLF